MLEKGSTVRISLNDGEPMFATVVEADITPVEPNPRIVEVKGDFPIIAGETIASGSVSGELAIPRPKCPNRPSV